MRRADGWFICRIGLVEAARAVGLVAGAQTIESLRRESAAFAVVEVDERLADQAASLTLERDLRTLDALHLAAALILPRDDLVFATWDRRLHAAADAEGFELLPQSLA
jgi:predicted nucleic acid-binding protein